MASGKFGGGAGKVKRKRFWGFLKLGGGILVGLLVVYGIGKWGGWQISKIECGREEGGECGEEVVGFLEQFKGKSWVVTASRKIERAVASNFSMRVRVKKQWGGKIEVMIAKQEPVAAVGKVVNGREGVWYLVALDGEVVELSSERRGLPEVLVGWEMEMRAGERFGDMRMLNAVKIVAGLAQQGRVVRAELKSDELWVSWPTGVEVVFPLNKDAEILVVALQLIMSQARIEVENLAQVDMRFKNPVLTFVVR